jgi:hypothetical protein
LTRIEGKAKAKAKGCGAPSTPSSRSVAEWQSTIFNGTNVYLPRLALLAAFGALRRHEQ